MAGERNVAVRVTDRAGNTDAAATRVSITDTGAPGTGSLEIENGARYTRRRSVTLALSWPPGATAMQLSQDPGFTGAGQQPLAAQLEWTLADRAPEVVRVCFLGGPGGALQDSIRLDTTRPRVRRATVDRSSRRVRLRVTDSVSGVASVQLAAD